MGALETRYRHIGRSLDVLRHDLEHAGFELRASAPDRGRLTWRLRRDRVTATIAIDPVGGYDYDLAVRVPTGITGGGKRRCAEVRELLLAVLDASFNVRQDARVDPRVSTGRVPRQ